VLASVFGRAFVGEPMMRWPLGDHGDIEERFTRCFEYFLEDLVTLGMVWEAGSGPTCKRQAGTSISATARRRRRPDRDVTEATGLSRHAHARASAN